jgi:hypothetical protein
MLSCPCIGRTITVDDDGPADFNNILEAIYDACDGDTVIVADGTYTGPYNNDLDFWGKAITLHSESGPENCIIDCNGSGRGFYFHSGEDANSVLDGFTITKGRIGAAGGILCQLSSPTITNCIITRNQTTAMSGTGGGISCIKSSPIIANCTITGNLSGAGAGIYCYKSSPKISNCTISNNSGEGTGGISCDDSSPTITNCNIIGNEGGGISFDGNLTIANCTINGNTAPWGGGILCSGGNSTITNCEISGNLAEGESAYGGGILCFGPWSLEITNSTITGNQAEWGGGIYCRGFNLVMNNCTLTGNLSANGDALACDSHQQLYPSSVQLSNCILWDTGAEIWNNDNSAITITYSDVRGSWPGEGNIDADPCFVEPGYRDANGTPNDVNDDFWVDGDYHLKSEGWRWNAEWQEWDFDRYTSRCIDAGSPGSSLGEELVSVPDDPNNEWGQNLRINIGAYGGTAEASMPPYDWALLGDCTNDGTVDFVDFAHLASLFGQQDDQLPGDFDRDGDVDLGDVALLTEDWLKETSWY